MNGIIACVERITKEIQSSEYINWTHITDSTANSSEENASIWTAITNLLFAIRANQDKNMSNLKLLYEERCRELDLAVAKLQIAEQRAFHEEESSESDDSDVPPLFIESETEDEIFEFNEFPTVESVSQLQQSFGDYSELKIESTLSVHLPNIGNDEVDSYKKEISTLQQQNKKYIEIGLEWKEKYKKAMEEMKKQIHENEKDMKIICNEIGQIKSKKVRR